MKAFVSVKLRVQTHIYFLGAVRTSVNSISIELTGVQVEKLGLFILGLH